MCFILSHFTITYSSVSSLLLCQESIHQHWVLNNLNSRCKWHEHQCTPKQRMPVLIIKFIP